MLLVRAAGRVDGLGCPEDENQMKSALRTTESWKLPFLWLSYVGKSHCPSAASHTRCPHRPCFSRAFDFASFFSEGGMGRQPLIRELSNTLHVQELVSWQVTRAPGFVLSSRLRACRDLQAELSIDLTDLPLRDWVDALHVISSRWIARYPRSDEGDQAKGQLTEASQKSCAWTPGSRRGNLAASPLISSASCGDCRSYFRGS